MSFLKERILFLYESSQIFFDSFIRLFKSDMSISKFNKFRLYFLNLIIESLTEFFDDESKIEKVINVMQIAFNVWNKNSINEEIKNNIFIFFFTASCFIVLKLENSEKVKKFKNWCGEHNIDMTYVFWAEKIILKRSHWYINQIYPSEITELIIREILLKNSFPEELIDNYRDIVNTYILFSLNEYSLYKKYNQILIALSCSLIGLSSDYMQNLNENDILKYKNLIQNEINNLNLIIDENNFIECQNNILSLLKNEEEENENKEEEKEEEEDFMNFALTRSSSTVSLIKETFSDYDKAKYNKNESLYSNDYQNIIINLEINDSKSFLGKKKERF